MKKYEVMYIINSSVEDEKRNSVVETVANIITENGGKIHFFCFAGKTASILDKKEILSIIITVGNYL